MKKLCLIIGLVLFAFVSNAQLSVFMATYPGAAGPTLIVSPTSLGLGTVTTGSAGTSQTYTVTGSNLTANDVITAPTGTEVSLDNSSFGSTKTITQSGGTITSTTVYVRIAASASVGAISANVTNVSTGSNNPNVAVTGTVNSTGGGDSAFFAFSLTGYTMPVASGSVHFVNVIGDPFTGIRTGDNAANTIHFSSVASGATNWPPLGGNPSAYDIYGEFGSTATGFPDSILRHAFFTYSGSSHTADSTVVTLANPQYQITGLSNAHTYTITVVGSINKSLANFASSNNYYLYNGTTTYAGTPRPYDAGNNTSGIVTFTSVVPDGSGKIQGFLFTVVGQETCILNGITIRQN